MMRTGNFKHMLVILLHLSYLISAGQSDYDLVWLAPISENDSYEALAFNRLITVEQLTNEELYSWGGGDRPRRRYVGISHTPSSDFNIYLTINNSVTPKIMTSMEISLNYAGVMNIKSLFFLRKKSQSGLVRN